jgi:helicase required for RNAi-mediated heterochromatin assembly 1
MTEDWRKMPEVPTVEELSAVAVDVGTNVIDGPYENVEEYLATHYELLREDAIAAMRDAISYIRDFPHSNDTHEIAIYENVGP